MAEKAIVAFGRYLRLLRERRGLSLDDVAALTKAYPEPVNKGYLSRAERGLSHIGFSKVVALGRAYEVPVDVFGEKWSLDLEVEHLKDPPETEKGSIQELLEYGASLLRRGARLEGYAVVQSLIRRAANEDVSPRFRDRAEQIAAVTTSHGIAAGSLGRFYLSQHEVRFALSLKALSAEYLPTAWIHLSTASRRLGNFADAQTFADRAIREASELSTQRFLGEALATRALLADAQGDHVTAIEMYKKACDFFRDRDNQPERARAMSNLANAYVSAGRFGAARRSLAVAYRIATASGAEGIRARTRILLGEIESSGGRVELATAHWMEALEIAKKSRDRVAAFKAEFQLFKHAAAAGHLTAAKAFGRRLNRLWPWIPSDEQEVRDFRALWAAQRTSKQRRVALAQH